MTVRATSAEAYRGLSHPVSDASIIAAYIRNAGRSGLTRREIADGLQIRVAALEDVIASKRAADRDKDRSALPYLESLREVLRSPGHESDTES